MTDEPTKPLHSGVGLSTRPETIAAHEGVLTADTVTKQAFVGATNTLGRITRAMSAMLEAHDSLREARPEDRLLGPGNVIRHVIPEARKESFVRSLSGRFQNEAGILAETERQLETTATHVEQRIDAALQNPRRDQVSVATHAAEIRGHVKSLKSPGDRMAWVSQQMRDGDRDVAAAILGQGVSAYTCGLDKKQQAMLRTEAEILFVPQMVAQRQSLADVRGKLQQAGRTFLAKYGELVPRPNIVPRRAARAEAALAALGGK
jgi:hypothetical protein